MMLLTLPNIAALMSAARVAHDTIQYNSQIRTNAALHILIGRMSSHRRTSEQIRECTPTNRHISQAVSQRMSHIHPTTIAKIENTFSPSVLGYTFPKPILQHIAAHITVRIEITEQYRILLSANANDLKHFLDGNRTEAGVPAIVRDTFNYESIRESAPLHFTRLFSSSDY